MTVSGQPWTSRRGPAAVAAAVTAPLLSCRRVHGRTYGRTSASPAYPTPAAPASAGRRPSRRGHRVPRVIELLIVAALIVLQRLLRDVGDGGDDLAQDPPQADGRSTSRGARKALALAEHPDNLLSTVQVGITLIAPPDRLLRRRLDRREDRRLVSRMRWPALGEYAHTIGIVTAVGLITCLLRWCSAN